MNLGFTSIFGAITGAPTSCSPLDLAMSALPTTIKLFSWFSSKHSVVSLWLTTSTTLGRLSVKWKPITKKKRKNLSTSIKCAKKIKLLNNLKPKFAILLKSPTKSNKPLSLTNINKFCRLYPKISTLSTLKNATNTYSKCHFSTLSTKKQF